MLAEEGKQLLFFGLWSFFRSLSGLDLLFLFWFIDHDALIP